MKVTEHTNFSSLDNLASGWNLLASESPTNSIFQRYEWNKLWWANFGQDASLCVITVHEADNLLAIAPLMLYQRKRNGLNETHLGFIGVRNHLSDYCDLLYRAQRWDAAQAILEYVWSIRNRWTTFELFNLPDDSATVADATNFVGAQTRRFENRYLYDAPRYIFKNDASDLEIANKKSLKRHYNRLKKQGQLEFVEFDASDASPYLDQFFAQHVARRALSGDVSSFTEPEDKEFCRQLVLDPTFGQFVRLSIVKLDDKPIAFHFGFEYDRIFYWYKPCFDPLFAELSPGEVLLKLLLESAIKRKLRIFDFTIGSEAFKYRFSNQIMRVGRLSIYNRQISFCLSRARRFASVLKAGLLKSKQ